MSAPKKKTDRTADVLGYPVTTHEEQPAARLYTLVRELKALHEKHRLPYPVTITLPVWRPDLARLYDPTKESA
jgi:hypothetical protein